MSKTSRLHLVVAMFALVALLAGACAGPAPTAAPEVEEQATEVPVEEEEPAEEEEPTEEEEPAEEEPAETEEEGGGTLVVALHDEPRILDPNTTEAWFGWFVELQVFEPLVEAKIDEQGNIEYKPSLATSWEMAEDALSWTFELKEGVTFHDGTPFNAEAVAFTINRIIDPEFNSPAAKPLLGGNVESAEAVEEYVVKINLNNAFPGFLSALSDVVLAPVSPAAVEEWGEDFGQHPVGTGPFMFEEWVTGDHITLVRNPDYDWGPEVLYDRSGPALLDEIIFRVVPEATVRGAMLEQGEAHVITKPNPPDIPEYEEDPDYQILGGFRPGTASLNWFNAEKSPTDELEVRRALLHAMDWDQVNQLVYHGSRVVAHSLLTPATPGYDPSLNFAERYPVDQEKARELLDEAGWVDEDGDGLREKDGQPMEMVWICFPGSHCQEGEVLQAQLRDVGAHLEIREMGQPANVQATQRGEHNIRSIGWGGLDSAQLMHYLLHTDNIGDGWNFTRYRSEELDSLIEKAVSELDEEQRIQYVKEIQEIVLDQALGHPRYNYKRPYGTTSKLEGTTTWSRGHLKFKDAYLTD